MGTLLGGAGGGGKEEEEGGAVGAASLPQAATGWSRLPVSLPVGSLASMDVFARPGQVIGQFAVGSAPPTASTMQHRRSAKRPIAETEPEAEFVFDVEGEMELEEANTQFSQYIQPGTGKRRTVVCKHWLRGLCKKGEMCDYLHEYDEDKMPVCQFYFSETVCVHSSSSWTKRCWSTDAHRYACFQCCRVVGRVQQSELPLQALAPLRQRPRMPVVQPWILQKRTTLQAEACQKEEEMR